MKPLGLTLSLSHRSGGSEPYITPTLPQPASIVRAWSMRRLIADYADGNALRELRTNGGTETDKPFLPSGIISLSGADAWANVIYDQKGAADSKLSQGTFSLCPKIYESSALLKGLYCNGNNLLTMASADASIETATASGTYSISAWINTTNSGTGVSAAVYRATSTSGIMVIVVTGGKLQVYMRSIIPQTSSTIISDGNWYHVVATMDVARNSFKVYLHNQAGTLLETLSATAGALTTSLTSKFSIGGRDDGSLDFTGHVNDVVLWGTTLSQADAEALNDATRGYYPASGAK